MKKKLIFCISILLLSTNWFIEAKEGYTTFRLQLEGKKYDSICLRAEYETPFPPLFWEKTRFPGHTGDGCSWTFEVPDSIFVLRTYELVFCFQPIDTVNRIEYHIKFEGIFGEDSLRTANIAHDKIMPVIKAKYSRTEQKKYPEGGIYCPNTTTVWEGNFTFISDCFEVNFEGKKQTELEAGMRTNSFDPGFFFVIDLNDREFEEGFSRYEDLIRQFPNSQVMMDYFRGFVTLPTMKTRKPYIERAYKLFSKEIQNSDVGKSVKKVFMSNPNNVHWDNIFLENSTTGKNEKLIQCPDKYNLLLFSASWCGACRHSIPIYKKLYDKAPKDRLEMIYLSSDNTQSIGNWKKLMEKEQIPWRSLLLLDDKKYEIQINYRIYSFPTILLIPPSGKAEFIELYSEEDVENICKRISQM